jgi:hypothetical protein
LALLKNEKEGGDSRNAGIPYRYPLVILPYVTSFFVFTLDEYGGAVGICFV